MEDLNRPVSRSEIDLVIKQNKKLSTNKSPGWDGFTGIFNQIYILKKRKKRTYTNSSETLPKDWRGGNKTFYEETDHPDSKTRQTHYQKNYRQGSLVNIDANILNKQTETQIQQQIKKFIHHDQVEFFPGSKRWFNIWKSINVIHHINKNKDTNHLIISIDAEKAVVKFNIHHPFMIKKKKQKKKLYQSQYRGNIPQHNKSYSWQTHSHYNTQPQKAESLLAKTWNKGRIPTLTTSLQNNIRNPGHNNPTGKRKKRYSSW